MKHTLRKTSGYRKTALAVLLLSVNSLSASAQICNNVSSLGINTGYNYSTNNMIAVGQADPEWRVTGLTPACAALPGAVVPGANALVVNQWPNLNANAGWISFLNAGAYVTTGNETNNTYVMILTRTFRLCQDDTLQFNFSIANDNFCTQIDIDNTPIGFSQPPSQQTTNFTSLTNIPSFVRGLTAGTHTINIRIHNFPSVHNNNAHGLTLIGNIQSTSGLNSLVGPGSPADCRCVIPPSCSDTCYWKVNGNNIIGGNNIFGTLTKDDVQVRTSAIDRGILTRDGLLGWNTMAPTAYLHVFCEGHNKEDGKISDVRFERLEKGAGNILVINNEGYVMDSKIPARQANAALEIEALKRNYEIEKERNDRLEKELSEVKVKLDLLLGRKSDGADLQDGNELYQNVPNPSNGQTVITYNIVTMRHDAAIVITSASGQVLQEFKINRKGPGNIAFDGSRLAAGTYFYSLVVDQEKAATRKMIIQ